tara:strand:+ start:397 stop:897 length:501 start_codon:yes stop_codon:yes gene_type:complete
MSNNLGGGFNGQSALRFGNAQVGGEVSKNRAILRRAFRNNKIKVNGSVVGKKNCGPYRSAFSLGDGLTRLNKSCGGSNQVKSSSRLSGVSLGDGKSNKDCNLEVSLNGTVVTTSDLPLESGNQKFVSDSSNYTTFKTLEGYNKTYNDKSFGGDDHNSSYIFLNNLR